MNTHISSEFKDQINLLKPRSSSALKLDQRRLIQSMIDSDEFHTQIKESLMEYREYEEEEIQFIPTYKYSNGSFDPEVSGWPDRIWYSTNNKIICSQYSTM